MTLSRDRLQALCDAANALRVVRAPLRLRLMRVPQGTPGNARKTNPAARRWK